MLARPATHWYRARKFIARNALAVSAAAAIVVTTLGGAAVALWQANNARLQARKAQAVQEFLTDVFLANTHEQADPLKAQNTTARELLTVGAQRIQTGLADAPEVKAEVLRTLGGLLLELGLPNEAVALERNRVDVLRAVHGAGDARVAEALLRLAEAMETSANTNERESVLAEAQRILNARARPSRRCVRSSPSSLPGCCSTATRGGRSNTPVRLLRCSSSTGRKRARPRRSHSRPRRRAIWAMTKPPNASSWKASPSCAHLSVIAIACCPAS